MKYAVISYWIGEYEMPNVWLYESYEEAEEALRRLYKQSYDLALEDNDFNKEESNLEETGGVISWGDELKRYFEIANIATKEEI